MLWLTHAQTLRTIQNACVPNLVSGKRRMASLKYSDMTQFLYRTRMGVDGLNIDESEGLSSHFQAYKA